MFRIENALGCGMFLLLMMVLGCDSEPQQDISAAKQTAALFVPTQAAFSKSYGTLDQIIQRHDALNGSQQTFAELGSCQSVVFEADSLNFFPAEISVAFMDACEVHGETYTGSMKATLDNYPSMANAKVDINFENFHLNGNHLNANYALVNKGLDETKRNLFEHQINNAVFTNKNGETISYGASILTTQLIGQATNWLKDGEDGILDDVWEETQIATFVDDQGVIYNVNTVIPLVKPVTCTFPVSGELSFESETMNFSIDFGAGDCDEQVMVIMGEQRSLLSF